MEELEKLLDLAFYDSVGDYFKAKIETEKGDAYILFPIISIVTGEEHFLSSKGFFPLIGKGYFFMNKEFLEDERNIKKLLGMTVYTYYDPEIGDVDEEYFHSLEELKEKVLNEGAAGYYFIEGVITIEGIPDPRLRRDIYFFLEPSSKLYPEVGMKLAISGIMTVGKKYPKIKEQLEEKVRALIKKLEAKVKSRKREQEG